MQILLLYSQLIGKGHQSMGLYCLGTRLLMSCLSSLSPKLLYDHMGHPHLSKLKRMIPKHSKF